MDSAAEDSREVFTRVAIIGTGLVGGSILRDALRSTSAHVTIWDIDEHVRSLVAATFPHILEDAAPRLRIASSLADAVSRAELVILATPVPALLELAELLPDLVAPGVVVTDVGSVKAPIVARLEEAFAGRDAAVVGGHPMAGRELSGFLASVEGLFRDATWALTPTASTDFHELQRIGAFVSSLGAGRIISCDPHAHDQMVAAVSHLPQLVSSTLAATIAHADDHLPGTMELAGTGYRDTTRVAASDPGMWRAIVEHNAHAIAPLVEEFAASATRLRDALAAEDWDAVAALVDAGRAGRARLHWTLPRPLDPPLGPDC